MSTDTDMYEFHKWGNRKLWMSDSMYMNGYSDTVTKDSGSIFSKWMKYVGSKWNKFIDMIYASGVNDERDHENK